MTRYMAWYDSPAYPFRALRQQVRSTYDPCTCDADGIGDGVDTGRPGCAVHVDGLPAFCMVPLSAMDCPEYLSISPALISLVSSAIREVMEMTCAPVGRSVDAWQHMERICYR